MPLSGPSTPDNTQETLKRGWRLFQERKLDLAEQVFRTVIQQQPQHGNAWHLYGQVVLCGARRTLPSSTCSKPSSTSRTTRPSITTSAWSTSALDQLQEAGSCFQNAVRLKPDYAEAYLNMGNVLSALGREDDAIRCYRRALRLRPDLDLAATNLGTALTKQGDLEEALAFFLTVKECLPTAHGTV